MHKLLSATLVVAACFSTAAAYAADPAVVNGKPVKQALLDLIIKDATDHGQTVDDRTRGAIIDKLINNELIQQAAESSGLLKTPELKALEELTVLEVRVNAYVNDFLKKNPIDEAALKAEYDKLKAVTSGTEYKASHILVGSEDEANSLIAQLKKGADFAQLAKEKSTDNGSKEGGGDLGWFTPDTMVKPFADAVVALQKGGMSATPVKTDYGWHVIRLEDTRAAQPPAFEAVKNDLAGSLQKQRLEKMIADLRAKAKIVRNTDSK